MRVRTRLLLFLPVVLSLAALAASECEEEADPGNLDPPTGSPVAVGEAFVAEDAGWSITVTSLSLLDSVTVRGETKRPLGVYLVIDFSMENITSNRQALGGNRFALVDEDGRTFRWYPDGTDAAGKGELGSSINPGLTGAARLVFDVPDDARGLQLAVAGGVRVDLGDMADIP